MLVAIRTTCGRQTGFGHLRRCLTLAEELRRCGHEARLWISGDEAGVEQARHAAQSAESIANGLDPIVSRLSAMRPSLLVVDDYAITGDQIAMLHRSTTLAVIDDIADRSIDADLVANGNANAASLHYRASQGCVMLLGPCYSLLRTAFRTRTTRVAPPQIERGLVLLGGSDPRGLTARVTRLFRATVPQAHVDVVVGPLASASPELMAQSSDERVRIHRAPDNLVELMTRADLAVSAGGQTNYELAALGVPAVSICVADNQRGNIEALAAVPTLVALFAEDDMTIASAIEKLARSRELRQNMSDEGQRLVDGLGATRVVDALEALPRKIDG